MKTKLIFLSTLVVVFVLGIMTGVAVSGRWAGPTVERRAWHLHAKQNFQRLVKDLALTPEQVERIEPLVIAAVKSQREHLKQIRHDFEELANDIIPLLTPEQQERFREVRRFFVRGFDRRLGEPRPDKGPRRPGEEAPPPPPVDERR